MLRTAWVSHQKAASSAREVLASSASSSPSAREVELELLACTAVEGSSAATAMASIPCT
tara:strand:- start:233 stop:409 length:177 start_codon:yes stop_codon:yes gene_type:complete